MDLKFAALSSHIKKETVQNAKACRYDGRFAIEVSNSGDEAVYPQRQITQALAGRMVDRVGERR